MLVVADSSPLIVLINIDCIEILPALFGQVVIPTQVSAELRSANRPEAVRTFMSSLPSWLTEREPKTTEQIPQLHPGELAAISLAKELNADLLLIDESKGRTVAANLQIAFTGTVGVLELAAVRQLLDLQIAFERIKTTDFWVSGKLLDERLRLFKERNRTNG